MATVTKNTNTKSATPHSSKVGNHAWFPTAKVAVVKTPEVTVAKVRTKFFYLRTKQSKYGVLSPKSTDVTEAIQRAGFTMSEIAESKELSSNRHEAVVRYCDLLELVPDTTPVAVAAAVETVAPEVK